MNTVSKPFQFVNWNRIFRYQFNTSLFWYAILGYSYFLYIVGYLSKPI